MLSKRILHDQCSEFVKKLPELKWSIQKEILLMKMNVPLIILLKEFKYKYLSKIWF